MAWPRVGLALVIGSLLALYAAPAAAQGPPADRGRLDVALATAVVFPTPTVADYDTGWVEHTGFIVSIASRPATEPWELRLRANTATMGGYGKPIDDILWREDGSTIWTPLAGTEQMVLQGNGDQDVTLHFRVRLDWSKDSPDTYSAGLSFSAVRP